MPENIGGTTTVGGRLKNKIDVLKAAVPIFLWRPSPRAWPLSIHSMRPNYDARACRCRRVNRVTLPWHLTAANRTDSPPRPKGV